METKTNKESQFKEIDENKLKDINDVMRSVQKIFKNNMEIALFYLDLLKSKGKLKSNDLRKLSKLLGQHKFMEQQLIQSEQLMLGIVFQSHEEILCLRRIIFRVIQKINTKLSILQLSNQSFCPIFLNRITTLAGFAQKLIFNFDTYTDIQQVLQVLKFIKQQDNWLESQIYIEVVEQNYVSSIEQFYQIFSKEESLFSKKTKLRSMSYKTNQTTSIRNTVKIAVVQAQTTPKEETSIPTHLFQDNPVLRGLYQNKMKRKANRKLSRFKFNRYSTFNISVYEEQYIKLKAIIGPLAKFIANVPQQYLTTYLGQEDSDISADESKAQSVKENESECNDLFFDRQHDKRQSQNLLRNSSSNEYLLADDQDKNKKKWSAFFKPYVFDKSLHKDESQFLIKPQQKKVKQARVNPPKKQNRKLKKKLPTSKFNQQSNLIKKQFLPQKTQPQKNVIKSNFINPVKFQSGKSQMHRILAIYEHNHINKLIKMNKDEVNNSLHWVARNHFNTTNINDDKLNAGGNEFNPQPKHCFSPYQFHSYHINPTNLLSSSHTASDFRCSLEQSKKQSRQKVCSGQFTSSAFQLAAFNKNPSFCETEDNHIKSQGQKTPKQAFESHQNIKFFDYIVDKQQKAPHSTAQPFHPCSFRAKNQLEKNYRMKKVNRNSFQESFSTPMRFGSLYNSQTTKSKISFKTGCKQNQKMANFPTSFPKKFQVYSMNQRKIIL